MNLKKIILDTNILISAILNPDGTARKTLEKAYGQFTIVQSEETYQELKTRIYKPKFDKYISNAEREDFLTAMQNNSLFIQTISKISDCRDMEDNKFLELAKDAQAICLITGDKDLLTLKSLNQYQNLIITAREFMELY
ncbi:putative toxin-antitoxin system toxin component, PIN family [Cyanobacterium aponinum]|uniref:PIN domain-containing protein n=1 Tax=Cyanobacterium aponinum (strain PCC 10605) TaxID=755178 RepID=K9Z5C3_CYAAP|nr:putative toxin-antitoxin system toxin component, PIN family [Cyanobacterium aponinum]AFZ53942.1 protein of unknown function DUF132 [Cyanobacterium aponinum PCC 10605]